jgi:hypothetical protein
VTISIRKLALPALAIAVLVAALLTGGPALYRFATEQSDPNKKPVEVFNLETATRGGFVYVNIEGHRFKIPKEYVTGVTTRGDGSAAHIQVRLVLPGLEPYDPESKLHRYEFSPYIGGGRRNKLYLSLGARQAVSLDELFSRKVTLKADAPSGIRVTARPSESDDPQGVEIYSSPNKQEPPDENGRVSWRPGDDYYAIHDSHRTVFFAHCYREVPYRDAGCEVFADFGPDINAKYDYGRAHFVRDWKHIHEHITGLIRSWMEPDQPTSDSAAPSR